jgi:hypothetical protein
MDRKNDFAKFFYFWRMSSTFYFVLPGLNNSGPQHWQTRWEKLHGFTRIHQRDWDTPDREDWIHTINETIAPFPSENVVLIAHSLACCAVAHWADRYGPFIKGAFLVAPSDVEGPNYPSGTTGFAPTPLSPLPFPSLVVASSDDKYVSLIRAAYFAGKWHSSFIDIGEKGHINADSGLGDWPEGYQLLQQL